MVNHFLFNLSFWTLSGSEDTFDYRHIIRFTFSWHSTLVGRVVIYIYIYIKYVPDSLCCFWRDVGINSAKKRTTVEQFAMWAQLFLGNQRRGPPPPKKSKKSPAMFPCFIHVSSSNDSPFGPSDCNSDQASPFLR